MSDEIVLLLTVPNEPLAAYWQSVLAEAGITAMVQPRGPGFGGWGSAALMEHDLYVRDADLERARALVSTPIDETDRDT